LYESTDEIDAAESAYQEVLEADSESAEAMRGLARIAEKRRDLGGAGAYWKRFTETVRPGDRPWYEGQYEQARLALERGEAERACTMLTELRPAMPGLSDTELRTKLNELHQQACR